MDDPAQRPLALPPAVAALAQRCGADPGARAPMHVELTQAGEMRADAAHGWAPFRARQSMALDRCGFVWRATTGPLNAIAITDALEEAGPRLSVTALGFIRLAGAAADAALTKGELQRYLAELPLAPDAILRNAALQWTVLAPALLRVAAQVRGVRAEVELALGADGLVASASTPGRPRLEGAASVERPWSGRFSDYREHRGRRLPFAAEAAWTLGGAEVAYWRGAMTSWTIRAGA